MQLRFFAIPVLDDGQCATELNRFLASHRIWSVDRQFVSDSSGGLWAVCVTYSASANLSNAVPKNPGVDYRQILNPDQFRVFVELRTLRKNLATEEGVPAYHLFTNEQLAAMARDPIQSVADVEAIPGVGPARARKYAARFLAAVQVARQSSPNAGSPG